MTRNVVGTSHHYPLPRRLVAYVHQPQASHAVIRTACSPPDGIVLPRSLARAWATGAESLRDAPIEQHRAKLNHSFTSEKAA